MNDVGCKGDGWVRATTTAAGPGRAGCRCCSVLKGYLDFELIVAAPPQSPRASHDLKYVCCRRAARARDATTIDDVDVCVAMYDNAAHDVMTMTMTMAIGDDDDDDLSWSDWRCARRAHLPPHCTLLLQGWTMSPPSTMSMLLLLVRDRAMTGAITMMIMTMNDG